MGFRSPSTRTRPLDVRCQKYSNPHSNYRQFELEEHVMYPIAARTIAPDSSPLCRYRIQAGGEWSHQCLKTRVRPSAYCTQRQNQDSSQKTT
ncbi:hypothetical protein TNCV_1487751 [Trichonephila clavipes]|nr:hypothetical protein TNCV_1487751 [Trichonephila clavipes]